ncbi:MAG: HDIG domain-containing protein [Prevotella sp.]|nr:HDIG domain-containing protein [Prevotella sp.]
MSKIKFSDDITWHDLLVRIALVVCGVILIVWSMPHDSQVTFKAEQGKPWRHADFTAPFDFPIYKSDVAIQAERDSIMRQYEPYYGLDTEKEGKMISKFTTDFASGIPGLTPDYISIIANRLHNFYQQGIMASAQYDDLIKDTTRMIRIVSGKEATSSHITSVYSPKSAYEQLFQDPMLIQHRALLQRCNLNDYIVPNLTYEKERSESSLRDLLESIPLASGVVQRGQKVVDRGQIVDEKTYRIIESFVKETERRQTDDSQFNTRLVGEALLTLLFIGAFTLYLSLFRKDYFERWRSIVMLYATIVGFAVIALTMVSHNVLHVYLLPFAMVPIFIRVFMDSRTAFMAHNTTIFIVAIALQHPLEFLVVEEIAGLAAIFSLRELSSRSQLFKTAIIVTLCAMAANLGTQLTAHLSSSSFLQTIDTSEYNYLMVNGALLFCSYPLLYLFERFFGFTSNITLIELSDMSKDILRRMSEVAPGTFQHSIQVGNLAAEIANKIGAKAQLVRTGALYHDIGKTQNPIYFTENQSGVNPHENLSYIDSAQVIISHVTDGLKLADKYNLPDVIRDFIATHHGQGKAKYFYVKYKNEHPDEDVDDLLFTYPGPNPFTREQAILMMADAVEAASRSLPDYTEQSIRDLVNRILDSQVADGYFRECPITFRDIQYAKTVLIEKLKTIYHTRISYPELKKQDKQETTTQQ